MYTHKHKYVYTHFLLTVNHTLQMVTKRQFRPRKLLPCFNKRNVSVNRFIVPFKNENTTT